MGCNLEMLGDATVEDDKSRYYSEERWIENGMFIYIIYTLNWWRAAGLLGMFMMSEQTLIQRMYCIISEVSQEFGSEININTKDAIKDSEWQEAMDSEISS